MRTTARKRKLKEKAKTVSSSTNRLSRSSQDQAVRSIFYLQRTIGNQSVQRLLTSKPEERPAALTDSKSSPAKRKLLALERTRVVQQGSGTHGKKRALNASSSHLNFPYRNLVISRASDGSSMLMRKVSLYDVIAHTHENVETALNIAGSLKTAKDLIAANSANLKYLHRVVYWLKQRTTAFEKSRLAPEFNTINIIHEYQKLAKRKDVKGLVKEGHEWQKYALDCYQVDRNLKAQGNSFLKKAALVKPLIKTTWALAHVPLALGGKPWEYLIANRRLDKLMRTLRSVAYWHFKYAKRYKIAGDEAWQHVVFFNKKADELIDKQGAQ